jgi:hypothetical protein
MAERDTSKPGGGTREKRDDAEAGKGEGGGRGAEKPGEDAADLYTSNKYIPVSGVTWNSSGTLLAVCYGRMDIEGTDYGRLDSEGKDTSTSCVAVWNLQRVFVKVLRRCARVLVRTLCLQEKLACTLTRSHARAVGPGMCACTCLGAARGTS